MNLTLPGSVMNNNSRITCKAILKNGGRVESSAYLSVQGNVQNCVGISCVCHTILFISLSQISVEFIMSKMLQFMCLI